MTHEKAEKHPHAHESAASQTEHHIEHELRHQQHDAKVKHHAYSPDFNPVFKELGTLRHKEGEARFHKDLNTINEGLHKHGVLPHMHIIEDGNGFEVVADSTNPRHAAIVSKSRREPHESKQEAREYKHLHYNGWEKSVTGGGGARGHFNSKAAEGVIPGSTDFHNYEPSGVRKDFIDEALKLAGLPLTPANEQMVNCIVEHESGWNPNSINLTDSNAAKGCPSQGLMQTIPETFQRYALEGYNSNIDDPLSNLVAGIRYAVARYPSHDENNAFVNVKGLRDLRNTGKYSNY
jgi:Transglycosylase SLT domain